MRETKKNIGWVGYYMWDVVYNVGWDCLPCGSRTTFM